MGTSMQIDKAMLLGLVNVLIADKQPSRGVQPTDDGIAWLNPQPLPPKAIIAVEAARSIPAVAAAISMASFQMADRQEIAGVPRAKGSLKAFVDDFCAGEPPRVLLPPPWPRFDLKPNALDLVVAAAQFHAAQTALKQHPLQETLAACADQLLDAAMAKLSPRKA